MTIRKEIVLRKLELIAQEYNLNVALNKARQEAKIKHGTDWRTKESLKKHSLSTSKETEPSMYDEYIYGEHWID